MPSRSINTEKAFESINSDTSSADPSVASVVSTKWGSMILEIQGELNLPDSKPKTLSQKEQDLFTTVAIPQLVANGQEITKDAVKFGKLEIEQDMKKATLYISTSQRLVGNVESVDPPLGVLKLDSNNNGQCEIVDVISKKVVFKVRPLPIM
ncbi:hypothetical protein OGAPHI_000078 [Ogataea philodendri]|uniref:Uncharacterized protein n=1 Tax=Ogataea philodendri TaxID=1378263 RepID=A0A9P8PIH3_9ASCO|nr:uncharacterized protein OGAPHI_000078 [Ogataea philodendri]KAH3671892.1 hypothetical protein OGAPHI_000078 [Ogataea philodendri]